MNKKLLAFILLASTGANAQPTLLSSEMLAPGSICRYKQPISLSPIDTTIQGANATWNFSSMTAQSVPDFVVTIANPASTPYGALFPTANYAYVESPSTAYRYFDLTSSFMDRVGSYSSSPNTFNDPQREYVFPLSMGVTNLDTWDNSSSSFGGNYNINCIGYGTLQLPAMNFQNALMVRVDFDETIYSMPVYFWYSSDNGAMLLEYTPGDGTFVSPFALYINSLVTGVEDAFLPGLRYNNPVADLFRLSFNNKESGNLLCTIQNMLGQVVYSESISASTGRQEVSVDFSSLPEGMYVFTLQSGENRKSIKLIKSAR